MASSRSVPALVICLASLALVAVSAAPAAAQEPPYFVTYNHYLEEPGNLEIALASTSGLPRADGAYTAPWLELEYGMRGWWTTELYLEGVTTSRDGSGFAGWRWENRFRPLAGEHLFNPVLYLEYEHTSEASRIQKEIVGSGPIDFEPISVLRRDVSHELEGKLIVSSSVRNWNIAENVIFEKNLSLNEGLEFGYSVGVSRPLGGLASGAACRFCRENFAVGVEAYGGMGSTVDGLRLVESRHFVAPVVAWHVSDRSTLRGSVGFGVTEVSDPYLIRLAWSYELPVRGGRR